MLKGHAKIELTNVHTGKKRTVEHDNLITNAVADRLKKLSVMYDPSSINSEFLPLNDKSMGGIILFQNSLDENVNNIGLPDDSENPITGYASNEANGTTDTKRGSRNLSESQELINGYKFVWDFSTSQGNGEISALALTHSKGGENPKGSNIVSNYHNFGAVVSGSAPNFTSDAGIICMSLLNAVDYDWENGIFTCVCTESDTVVTIRKYRINIGTSKIGINEKLVGVELLSTNTITPPSDMSGSLWVNGNDGYYYGVLVNGKSGKIVRINKTSLALDTSYSLSVSLSYSYSVLRTIYQNGGNRLKVVNGYLYYVNNASLLKINLSDANDITEITLSTTVSLDALVYHNGIFHAGDKFIDPTDYSVSEGVSTASFFARPSNMTDECVFVSESGVVVSFFNAGNQLQLIVGTVQNYLATINNLDAPVTKTSQEVMKITYTITEV